MKERWAFVVGYEDQYEVSSFGRVASLINPQCIGTRSMLALVPDKDGYLQACLCVDQKRKNVRVHQAVMAAFVGPCPEGMESNHKDGNKSNNRLTNLEYRTKQYNILHSRRILGRCVGERHGRSKFSNATVAEMRIDLRNGMPHKTIARKYGCSVSLVGSISQGRLRKSDHVPLKEV